MIPISDFVALQNHNTLMIVQRSITLETRGILTPGLLARLAERVKEQINGYFSFMPVITCAASLAHHGLLGSLQEIKLEDVDLTLVPSEHLASLFSCVTELVNIWNFSGCTLIIILDSVKSEVLSISTQSLGIEETRALVRAMESCVKEVDLDEEVTLDIGVLMEYSGQGKCSKVDCYENTAGRYRKQLRAWAASRNWEVTHDTGDFNIKRINIQSINYSK